MFPEAVLPAIQHRFILDRYSEYSLPHIRKTLIGLVRQAGALSDVAQFGRRPAVSRAPS